MTNEFKKIITSYTQSIYTIATKLIIMSYEQTLKIIQETNNKANNINIVETIENGRKIHGIDSSYIAEAMSGNALPYFWDELLKDAKDEEEEYWNILNKHLETGIFIGLAYINDNYCDDEKYDEKTQSAPMHYEIDVCGNIVDYDYVGEVDESDYMTTTFGIALKKDENHTTIEYGRVDPGCACFMPPEFEAFDETSRFGRSFTFDFPLNQKIIQLMYENIVFDE